MKGTLYILNRKEQKVITRKKLFDTAISLFLKEGYDNVSIDKIVNVAGFSKGTFYHHFVSKEAILLEYKISINEQLQNEIKIALKEKQNQSSKDFLRTLIYTVVEYSNENFEKIKVVVEQSGKTGFKTQIFDSDEISAVFYEILKMGLNGNEFANINSLSSVSKFLTYALLNSIEEAFLKRDSESAKKQIVETKFLYNIIMNGILVQVN